MKQEPETRRILIDQEPYLSVINQRLEVVGPRGVRGWVSDDSGGNFFDPTPEEKRIIEQHGSPVIVYSNGDIELVNPEL